MLCDRCKERPASVHITQIANNVKVEKHLCAQCAQECGEVGINVDTKFAGIQDLLKGMFCHGVTGLPSRKNEVPCPSCGMDFADFCRSGKIGCGDCFNAFGDQLEPVLRRIHGASCHTGKVPKRSGGKLALRQKLRQLKQNLEHHVAREEYEQAAKIRDEIKILEKELQDRGEGP